MEWIELKKEGPVNGGKYLVTDGKEIQIMDYFGKYKGSDDWSSIICSTLNVTHWMELPKLPN